MGAALYLSFLLLIFCLSRAARAQLRDTGDSLDLATVPESVNQAICRAAQGIVVTEVRVALHGVAGLRYRVCGLMPDGQTVELDVHGDGTVYRRSRGPAPQAQPLPGHPGPS